LTVQAALLSFACFSYCSSIASAHESSIGQLPVQRLTNSHSHVVFTFSVTHDSSRFGSLTNCQSSLLCIPYNF